jgi:hypothetical protein
MVSIAARKACELARKISGRSHHEAVGHRKSRASHLAEIGPLAADRGQLIESALVERADECSGNDSARGSFGHGEFS